MALGTPTGKGYSSRGFNTNDVVISVTSSDNEFLLCGVITSVSSANTPDSITGHGTWSQIGSTEQTGTRFCVTLYGCIVSSGSTADVTISESTTAVMGAMVIGISGVDVSSGVAGAITQSKQGNGYGTSASVTFDTSVTKTTVAVGGSDGKTITWENTQIYNQILAYGDYMASEYAAAGDTTPSYSLSSADEWAMIAVELKEAAVGGTTLQSSLMMMGVGI